MKSAFGRALLLGGLAVSLLAIAIWVFVPRSPRPIPPRPAGERPTLLLLTSLPLVFGEDFSIQDHGSPALEALRKRYKVVSISVTDPDELKKGGLLLMAQPIAQPAEDLVALDRWVEAGGRVLILADPMLEWPSKRPLGDPLRPPAMFMDTGLLGHWGVRLDAPDRRGEEQRTLGGFRVLTVSPGRLSGTCRVAPDGLTAHCRVRKGEVTIVADADLLNVGELGSGAAYNLDGLLSELASLEALVIR
ncbi:MAG TPA: DUF4350 domain-containing protein [Sphingomicrobium sp.]|jgi:hypothetical protein|nr:DUF4350 domain-containing protein [Sphingomicrobium sp.]